MNKVRSYRICGSALCWFGILLYLADVSSKIVEINFSISTGLVLGAVIELGLNIFLWAGLALLWRADRNEYPDRISKYSRTLIIYAFFTAIVMGMLIVLVGIPSVID